MRRSLQAKGGGGSWRWGLTGALGTLWGREHVHSPDGGDGFSGDKYVKTYRVVHFKYVHFLCVNHRVGLSGIK